MTERYEVHNMIKSMDIGQTMDLEVCKSLIEKYGSSRDIELLITDNGRNMTYGEVEDQLNRYHKREEILKKTENIDKLLSFTTTLREKIEELQAENKQLKEENEELKKQNENLLAKLKYTCDKINYSDKLREMMK